MLGAKYSHNNQSTISNWFLRTYVQETLGMDIEPETLDEKNELLVNWGNSDDRKHRHGYLWNFICFQLVIFMVIIFEVSPLTDL